MTFSALHYQHGKTEVKYYEEEIPFEEAKKEFIEEIERSTELIQVVNNDKLCFYIGELFGENVINFIVDLNTNENGAKYYLYRNISCDRDIDFNTGYGKCEDFHGYSKPDYKISFDDMVHMLIHTDFIDLISEAYGINLDRAEIVDHDSVKMVKINNIFVLTDYVTIECDGETKEYQIMSLLAQLNTHKEITMEDILSK